MKFASHLPAEMEESANPPQEDTDAAAHPVTVEQTAMASIGITISKLITLFPFTTHKQLSMGNIYICR